MLLMAELEAAPSPPALKLGAWPPVDEIERCSCDSDHDLAFMVSDFLENWSYGSGSRCSSDSDSGYSDLSLIGDKLAYFRHDVDQHEIHLSEVVQSLLVSINEMELNSVEVKTCNAGCIRQTLVKLLKNSGYDAAVCVSKWQGSGKVPGGEHEYIDVLLEENTNTSGRLIIDIDFRSNFEIARAVKSYDLLLHSLPAVFVGYQNRLKQYLQVMVEAARCSLKQNSMPLPPWRSLAYMQSKWQPTSDRKIDCEGYDDLSDDTVYHPQCIAHLNRIKTSLQSGKEQDRLIMKHLGNDDFSNHRLKFSRRKFVLR